MRGVVLAAVVLAVLSAEPVKAGDAPDGQATIRGCITAAAKVYRLPPAVLVILLNVEGGSLGRVSPNTNGTVDIGPIQVNEIWLPDVAAHWPRRSPMPTKPCATISAPMSRPERGFCAVVSTRPAATSGKGWATTTRTRPSIRPGIFGRYCGRSSGCARSSSTRIRLPRQTWRKRPRRPLHRRVD